MIGGPTRCRAAACPVRGDRATVITMSPNGCRREGVTLVSDGRLLLLLGYRETLQHLFDRGSEKRFGGALAD